MTFDISTLLAALAVLYSAVQTRSLRQANAAGVYQSLVTTQMKLESTFLQWPELRRFVYENQPLPPADTDVGQQARAVIDFSLQVADLIHNQSRLIPRSVRKSWTDYAKQLTASQAAREYISGNPEWFPIAAKENAHNE